MILTPQPRAAILEELKRARIRVSDLEKIIEREVLALLHLPKGSILRDQDTGARYRVSHVNVWEHNGEATAYVIGKRTYKTGRRDAYQQSHLNLSRMVLDTSAPAGVAKE